MSFPLLTRVLLLLVDFICMRWAGLSLQARCCHSRSLLSRSDTLHIYRQRSRLECACPSVPSLLWFDFHSFVCSFFHGMLANSETQIAVWIWKCCNRYPYSYWPFEPFITRHLGIWLPSPIIRCCKHRILSHNQLGTRWQPPYQTANALDLFLIWILRRYGNWTGDLARD